jgi:thioredoxin
MNTTVKMIIVAVLLAAVVGVIAMKQGGADPSPQAAPITTAPITTAPATAAPITTEPVTTAPVTTVQVVVPAIPAEVPDVPTALPRMVDLGAGKCIPCKAMEPILEELRHDFTDQFEVIFIDVWKDEGAGQAYGVRVIPTQVFFDSQGNELFRHEGFYSREEILAKWAELGVELKLPAATEAGT